MIHGPIQPDPQRVEGGIGAREGCQQLLVQPLNPRMVGGGEVEDIGADAGWSELARRIEIGGKAAQIDHVVIVDADQHSLAPGADTGQASRALRPQRLHPDTHCASVQR